MPKMHYFSNKFAKK